MILKSICLRLAQFIAGSVGLYCLLMAGTLLLQTQFELVVRFAIASGVLWLLWGLLTFLIRRYDSETIREVALVVYPISALLALALGVTMGFWLEDLVQDARLQSWTLVAAGVLLAIVMIIRCLDIRWMRNANDLRSLEDAVHHD